MMTTMYVCMMERNRTVVGGEVIKRSREGLMVPTQVKMRRLANECGERWQGGNLADPGGTRMAKPGLSGVAN